MRRLRIRNPNLENSERTYLTAQYTSGTTVSVVNTFAFSDNDYGVFGNPNEEKTEIKKISDADSSKTQFTIASALNFSHPKDTVVIRSPWDQVEISRYRSAAWTVISTSGLQFDKSHTIYIDSGGLSTDSYRWRFYNSSSTEYSEYSPTFAGTGFTDKQVGKMVERVRKITNTEDDENTIKDDEIVNQLNLGQKIIYGIRKDWWFLRWSTDTSITTTQGTFKYNLDLMGGGSAGSPASTHKMGRIKTVKYNFNDGTDNITYQLQYKTEVEFDRLTRDQSRQNDDNVEIYTIRPPDSSSTNGYIEVYPTPDSANGTFHIDGYTEPADLDDFGDTSVVPITGILENLAISFVERIRGNDSKAEYYEELFYGPPPSVEDRRRLTGIALLEQLQGQERPAGQPMQLKRFLGQRALGRLYGNRTTGSNRDSDVINYW